MKLTLKREFFKSTPYELLSHKGMRVTAFKYSTGIEALKVENDKGFFVILPFRGQQIWEAEFAGRNLKMKTMMEEPRLEDEFLKTYGGFLYHCGISAFGAPQADDNHPHHGETPNINYDNAYIVCDEDDKGAYITVGGVLDYNISFVRRYLFNPECRLYQGETVMDITVNLKNMRATPMEYMYLSHINFIPMDGAELIYSAKRDAEHVRLCRFSPDLPEGKREKMAAYMDALEENPAVQDKVGAEGQIYEPELCFIVKYETDDSGYAYTMQYKKGEGAHFVAHPAKVLPVGVRWISRTGNEDAMGMILPATDEHLGYMNAKRKGTIKSLEANGELSFTFKAGYIDEETAQKYIKKVEEILK